MTTVSILRELNVNSSEIGLDELGSHLRRRRDDIYYLTPLRFEQLVEDVFTNLGYATRRTLQTRDGGYDIILLERSTGDQILVECKRYRANRRVGVGIVRELIGVQILTGIRRAKLVTSSTFTKPAMEAAESLYIVSSSLDLELVDSDDLFRALEIYNTRLPPLNIELYNRLGEL